MLSKFPSVSTRCKKKNNNNNYYLRVDYISESFFNFSQVFKVDGLYERPTDKHLSVRIGIQITKILKYNYMQ